MNMEHLAIWFEDTTANPDRVAPTAPARGLPLNVLETLVATVPETRVFAYRLLTPEILSAVCMAVPTVHPPEVEVGMQLRQLAVQHGTIAWVRHYHEASYKAGWDEGTPLFPENPTVPMIVGALPSAPAAPLSAPHDLSLTLATLDELLAPSAPLSPGAETLALDEVSQQRVVAQVVAHTATDGNMVPWPQAAAALQQVLARTSLTVSPEREGESPARRHFELMTIHEGLGQMDRIAVGALMSLTLALGSVPAGLLMGAGWMAWRKWLEWQAERSSRTRARLLKAVGHIDPSPVQITSPTRLALLDEREARLNSPRRVAQWTRGKPEYVDLMAWVHAWWPLHEALVQARRRPALSLDHPGRWASVAHEALVADLVDAQQRPLPAALLRAAHDYREAMAPWLAKEETLVTQWEQVLTAMNASTP